MEELENKLQLLWDIFSSLSTKSTFDDHRLDHTVCTTTSIQPFTLVGSTSPGGVHSTSSGRVNCGNLHLYKVFGLTPPPPTVSQFNQPRLRLHTGQRHGPWAPTRHLDMSFLCGTWNQPRAPDHLVYGTSADRLSHRYVMWQYLVSMCWYLFDLS